MTHDDSHVAALLYKLEAAARLGITSMACTESHVKWNNYFTNRVNPVMMSNIRFYNDESVARVRATADKGRATVNMDRSTISDQQGFLQDLTYVSSKPVTASTRQQAKRFQREQYVKQVRFLHEDSGSTQVKSFIYRSMGEIADPHSLNISIGTHDVSDA